MQFEDAFDNLRRRVTIFYSSEALRELGCVFAIALLTGAMLFPALRGDWPVGHDHPVHLFRIWQFRETILHHGTPWTWSHRWFTGYPQNVIYPVGADLFVLTIQALSLGQLSLGQAYGIAFWLFYFLYGFSCYFFVRRALGSRVAGLIAALWLLTEPGSNDTGGWFWLVDVGVWTAALGMVPALLGTVRLAGLLENPRPKTAAIVAVCFGLAVLCHPLHLIYFGLAIPLLFASRYLSEEFFPRRNALLLTGVATLLGLCLASFWLVPYLSASSYASEAGEIGKSLNYFGMSIMGDGLFRGMHLVPMFLGLIGSAFLLRARRTLPLFMGLFVFVCIVGSSSTFADLFGSGVMAWLNKHIISTRLLMLAKPFWYGAAAFLIVSGWDAAKRMFFERTDGDAKRTTTIHTWIRRGVLIALVCALVLPIVIPAAEAFVFYEIKRPTAWQSQRNDTKARAELVDFINEIASQDPQFFRIAHGFDPNDDLTDLGIALPCPLFKVSYTPTGHFKYNVASLSNDALRTANVRFAIIKHPVVPERPDFHLIKIFEQQLWFYNVSSWNPDPFEIKGSGPVTLQEFSDENIVLKAGSGAGGLLRLNVTNYPKWHATRNNVPVTITSYPRPGLDHSSFMQVELSPGTYRFHYRRDFTDYLGTILCLVGIAGCIALWLERDYLGLRQKLEQDPVRQKGAQHRSG